MKAFIFIFSLILSFNSSAAGLLCAKLFPVKTPTAYEIRNKEIAKKYPTFKAVLSDPQKYFRDITERFELQKSVDPSHPYDFDFSEWSRPLFLEMHKLLLQKKSVLIEKLATMKSGPVRKWMNRNKISNVELGIEYYNELLAELEQHSRSGKITYRETFELSYFYSRAAGMFDASTLKVLNARDRVLINLDEFTEGYQNRSVAEELDLYHQRKVKFFDRPSPISTWEAAAKPFEDAIFNKEKLELLILPTTEALNEDIFMHLLSSDIHLVAVGVEPIAADGYNRPSGLFFVHDLRHSSFMYYRTLLYKREHELNRNQIDIVSRFMAGHARQLDIELDAMTDRNLAGAIRFYLFNQHHDSGYQFAPSSYLVNNAFHAPFILYSQLFIAGQARSFKSITALPRARKWLENFWLKRVSEEEALIRKLQGQAGD